MLALGMDEDGAPRPAASRGPFPMDATLSPAAAASRAQLLLLPAASAIACGAKE